MAEELGAMLDSLRPQMDDAPSIEQNPTKLDEEYLSLLHAMGYDIELMDGLMERTGLTANAISSMLLVLELEGYVSTAPGGGYCRTAREAVD